MFGVHPSGCSFGVHGGTYGKIWRTRLRLGVRWQVRATPLSERCCRFVSQIMRERGVGPAPVRTADSGSVDLFANPQIAITKPGKIGFASKNLRKPHILRCFCIFREIELSPTFRLDGGTVPPKKRRGRLQNPQCFAWFSRRKPPKKRTVLFDAKKFTKNPKKCAKNSKKAEPRP